MSPLNPLRTTARGRRETGILVVGLVFSVLLHGLVLLPILIEVANNKSPERFVELASAIEPPPPEPEPESPELGIEDSMAKTMNWIGYEEFEEHLARLGETDQAEFIMQPTGGGGAPPPTPVAPEAVTPPVTTPPEATETSPQPREITPAAPSLAERKTPSETDPQIPDAALKPDQDRIEPRTADKTNPEAEEGTDSDDRAPKPGAEAEAETPPEEPAESQEEATDAEREEPKEETPETPPSTPKPPSPEPPAAPGKGPGEGPGEGDGNGEGADRESDATSVVDVPPELWKRGRPLAARGVELQTRRPVLSTLTQISARFGSPLVEIRFDAEGRPVKCTILVSSGDRRVDEPILDSLYRWRAKGEKLSELKKGETFDVKLRFMLR